MTASISARDWLQHRDLTWPMAGAAITLWCLVAASTPSRLVLMVLTRQSGAVEGPIWPDNVASSLVALMLASVGALVILRGDVRRYGWILLAMGIATGMTGFAADYSLYSYTTNQPGSLPLSDAAVWIQDLWMFTWFIGFLLLPALFPDGRTASRRWSPAVLTLSISWLVLISAFALTERPASNVFLDQDVTPANPLGVLPIPEMVINVGWVAVSLTSMVAGVGSLITRWRGADFELRQQVKWVLYAFGLVLGVGALSLLGQVIEETAGVDLSALEWFVGALFAMAILGLAGSLGIAVLRYRLYRVDVVINRTLVYTSLTAIVVTTYVTVVLGVGFLVPVDDIVLSLAATGLVAVAFEPLRERVQHTVNALMFGRRDDPYGVVSELGALLARSGTPGATLQSLTEMVASALKLPGVAVELEREGAWDRQAIAGDVRRQEQVVFPLHYQGEIVGRLAVAPRSPGEQLSPRDERLLQDIAHQAAALAHGVRLLDELQQSREELVLAREEERRRIRRDLHDGLGPALASQTFRLDAILARLGGDPEAAKQVSAVKRQNQELVSDIRRLVHELRPPAIDELGVVDALRAHIGQLDGASGTRIRLEATPSPLPPLPAAVEVATYRIVREAITNVLRHAEAGRCIARLEVTEAELSIAVTDDGLGIGSGSTRGVGLASMRERAEELGGTFEIATAPAGGTGIRVTLPLPTIAAYDPRPEFRAVRESRDA